MTMAKQAHPLGLYLHIPFCRSKCAYCDFYSLSGREDRMDAYTAALERHLIEVAPQAAQHSVDTVYFGGGTPSYLGEKRLAKLLKAVKKHYHVDPHAEITLEANPDSAGDWKASGRCGGRASTASPWGPVHGRRLSPGLGPHPHMAAGAGGRGRLPEGQIPGRESGPHLRPAGADHGAVGKDPLRRPDPPAEHLPATG